MLHKARCRFGRWTCNHDSFSSTTKTRILDLGAGERGRTRRCSSLAVGACVPRRLCWLGHLSLLPGHMSRRVDREEEGGCGGLVAMGAAGWVVNWWLGAIPRMDSVIAFLDASGRPARLEWMNGRAIYDQTRRWTTRTTAAIAVPACATAMPEVCSTLIV